MQPNTSNNSELIIRADASKTIGSGHVMRCLALAQAWKDKGGSATFVTAMNAGSLFDRFQEEKIEVIQVNVDPASAADADMTITLANKHRVKWIVLDGYHFDSLYQKRIKDAGLKLLVIDDNGDYDHYYADIIVNQNLHAYDQMYNNREPYTHLLLGTKYCLLRREFLKYTEFKRVFSDKPTNILISLGGSDPDNVTLSLLQAVKLLDEPTLEIKVVIGGANLYYKELLSFSETMSCSVELIINATNMPEIMMWADIAVSGGGSTCWELAFLGLPAILIIIADNQRGIAESMAQQNAAICINWQKEQSPSVIASRLNGLITNKKLREDFSNQAKIIVDGSGAERVLTSLT